MKNLIIGASDNYNYEQLKPWVKSALQFKEFCDVVLMVFNCSTETVEKLTNDGIDVVVCGKQTENSFVYESELAIHVNRFIYMYEYLRDKTDKYKFVVSTDVFDVVFQKNPFEWLENNLQDKKVVISSECIEYQYESWGNQNLLETFGPYIHERYKNKLIYNVGVLGGYFEDIKDLFLNIFLMSLNRPIKIVDQAVFNMMINTHPYKDVFKYTGMESAWACQLGTVKDPLKIERFKPYLTEKEPIIDNDMVKNCNLQEFYIVHQYNRIPEWDVIIRGKYS